LTDADEDDAADRAWDQAIGEAITKQSIQKMGISVADGEVRDVVFYNPPAEIKKQFSDSLGQYHEEWYFRALRDPKNDSIVRSMEEGTRDQILHMKWQQAMVSTVRVTDSEAYHRYMNDSAKAFVQVVRIMAPQSNALHGAPTQQELQAYYD